MDDEKLPTQLENEVMKQAVSELKKFSRSEIKQREYELRLMAQLDENTRRYEYEQEGIEKGREESEKKIIKNMFLKGMDNAAIVELTGIAKETIDQLRKETKKR